MIRTKNVKGISESPRLFGIRGNMLLYMLALMSIGGVVVFLVFFVQLIQGNIAFSALTFLGLLLYIASVYYTFYRLSKPNDFKGLNNDIEAVSNQDILKIIKHPNTDDHKGNRRI